MKKQIGDRMKINYEEAYKIYLPMRLPTIIRLDGKTFHTFTKKMDRPFDEYFMRSMAELSQYLVKEIQTAQFTYVQSDEISILLHPYRKLDTDPWFANEVQKMVSVSAGLASSWFSMRFGKEAIFDSRVFVIPESEVVNYFIWRQMDCTRNSVTMVAQSLYSHKELHKKNGSDKQEMIFQKGQNWDKYPTYQKRGTVCTKDFIDREIPIFTQDRGYINKFLEVEDQ